MDQLHGRRNLLDVTQDLVAEFHDRLPAGSVIRCVARCREELWGVGVREGLADAVLAMSRRRLVDRVPPAQLGDRDLALAH
jgi:hypothetical protein